MRYTKKASTRKTSNHEEIIQKYIDQKKKNKVLFIFSIVVLFLLLSFILWEILNPLKSFCNQSTPKEDDLTDGELKLNLVVLPTYLHANEENTLVLIFTIQNVGNTSVRVVLPARMISFKVTGSNGQEFSLWAEGFYDPPNNSELIILLPSVSQPNRSSNSITGYDYGPYSLTGFFNRPDNYTFTAIYNVEYPYDRYVTLAHWRGTIVSNEVILKVMP